MHTSVHSVTLKGLKVNIGWQPAAQTKTNASLAKPHLRLVSLQGAHRNKACERDMANVLIMWVPAISWK